jgi:molybdenum cofactor cytidylyltransferase
MKAVAIILAAGEARKMGQSKALIEHEGGKSFLQSLASTFGKAGCQVMGIIGKDAAAVREQHPAIDLVEADRWADGLLTTIKAGLGAALEEGADMVLIHPVDMPAVRASTLKTLIKAMGDSEEGLRPEFEGAAGFPLVLSRALAERVRDSSETQFEPVLQSMKLRRVSVKDPGVMVNINTPETYERLFGSPPRLAPPPKRRGGGGGKKAASTGSDVGTSPSMMAAPEE